MPGHHEGGYSRPTRARGLSALMSDDAAPAAALPQRRPQSSAHRLTSPTDASPNAHEVNQSSAVSGNPKPPIQTTGQDLDAVQWRDASRSPDPRTQESPPPPPPMAVKLAKDLNRDSDVPDPVPDAPPMPLREGGDAQRDPPNASEAPRVRPMPGAVSNALVVPHHAAGGATNDETTTVALTAEQGAEKPRRKGRRSRKQRKGDPSSTGAGDTTDGGGESGGEKKRGSTASTSAPNSSFVSAGNVIQLQLETISPAAARVLFYGWYFVLLVATVLQLNPNWQWNCSNVCGGAECSLRRSYAESSHSCAVSYLANASTSHSARSRNLLLPQESTMSQQRRRSGQPLFLPMPMPSHQTTTTAAVDSATVAKTDLSFWPQGTTGADDDHRRDQVVRDPRFIAKFVAPASPPQSSPEFHRTSSHTGEVGSNVAGLTPDGDEQSFSGEKEMNHQEGSSVLPGFLPGIFRHFSVLGRATSSVVSSTPWVADMEPMSLNDDSIVFRGANFLNQRTRRSRRHGASHGLNHGDDQDASHGRNDGDQDGWFKSRQIRGEGVEEVHEPFRVTSIKLSASYLRKVEEMKRAAALRTSSESAHHQPSDQPFEYSSAVENNQRRGQSTGRKMLSDSTSSASSSEDVGPVVTPAPTAPLSPSGERLFDIQWQGGFPNVFRTILNRFVHLTLDMNRPQNVTVVAGTSRFEIMFTVVVLYDNSSGTVSHSAGPVFNATVNCLFGQDACETVTLPTGITSGASNFSGIVLTALSVPESLLNATLDSSIAALFQRPGYTLATLVVRYVCLALTIGQLVLFAFRNRMAARIFGLSVSRKRPGYYEQRWVLILMVGLILYLNPLFAAGVYIVPEPQFFAFIEFRMPLYFVALILAFMFALLSAAATTVRAVSNDPAAVSDGIGSGVFMRILRAVGAFAHKITNALQMPPILLQIVNVGFVLVIVALDIADASTSDWDWTAEHCPNYACSPYGYAIYSLIAVYFIICTVWLYYIANNLGKKPYLSSRPQQLAVRLFIFFFLTFVIYNILSSVLVIAIYSGFAYHGLLQISNIVVAQTFVSMMAFAFTSVPRTGDVPPHPSDPYWRKMVWEPSWFSWVALHGGSQYVFFSEREQRRFLRLQLRYQQRQRSASSRRGFSLFDREDSSNFGVALSSQDGPTDAARGQKRRTYGGYDDGDDIRDSDEYPQNGGGRDAPPAYNASFATCDEVMEMGPEDYSTDATSSSPGSDLEDDVTSASWSSGPDDDDEDRDRDRARSPNSDVENLLERYGSGATGGRQAGGAAPPQFEPARQASPPNAEAEGLTVTSSGNFETGYERWEEDKDGTLVSRSKAGPGGLAASASQRSAGGGRARLEPLGSYPPGGQHSGGGLGAKIPRTRSKDSNRSGGGGSRRRAKSPRGPRRFDESGRILSAAEEALLGPSGGSGDYSGGGSYHSGRSGGAVDAGNDDVNALDRDNDDPRYRSEFGGTTRTTNGGGTTMRLFGDGGLDDDGRRGGGLAAGVSTKFQSVFDATISAPAHVLDRVEHGLVRTAVALHLVSDTNRPFFCLETCIDSYNLSWEAYGVFFSAGDEAISTGIPVWETVKKAFDCDSYGERCCDCSSGPCAVFSKCCCCCPCCKESEASAYQPGTAVLVHTNEDLRYKERKRSMTVKGWADERLNLPPTPSNADEEGFYTALPSGSPSHARLLAEPVISRSRGGDAAAGLPPLSPPAVLSPNESLPFDPAAARAQQRAVKNNQTAEERGRDLVIAADGSIMTPTTGPPGSSRLLSPAPGAAVDEVDANAEGDTVPLMTSQSPDSNANVNATAEAAPQVNTEQYGYRSVAVYVGLDVQVIISVMDKTCARHRGKRSRIAVAFRGTENLSNAVQDVRLLKVVWSDMASDSGLFATTTQIQLPRVHAGFLEVWDTLKPQVMATIAALRDEDPDAEVLVTGHSLGGAIATLCAYVVQKAAVQEGYTYPSPIVYTFGMPRVGNTVFRDEYNKKVPQSYRVVNESDAVSHISLMMGAHTGMEVCIDRHGNFICDPMFIEQMFRPMKGTGSAIGHHTMTAYGQSLNAMTQRTGLGMCPSRCLDPYVVEDDQQINRPRGMTILSPSNAAADAADAAAASAGPVLGLGASATCVPVFAPPPTATPIDSTQGGRQEEGHLSSSAMPQSKSETSVADMNQSTHSAGPQYQNQPQNQNQNAATSVGSSVRHGTGSSAGPSPTMASGTGGSGGGGVFGRGLDVPVAEFSFAGPSGVADDIDVVSDDDAPMRVGGLAKLA